MHFVVQEHFARTHHFDFRLERDGVFKSWAVPKGLPEGFNVRRLAIEVADHDLAFGDFEGSIPPGEYGAGTIECWDRGTYDVREWSNDQIIVDLHGERIDGTYAMTRFRRKGDKQWLIVRMDTS